MIILFLLLLFAPTLSDNGGASCLSCIDQGGVWQNNCFSTGTCSLDDFGCCLSEECCNALEGCRDPNEWINSQSCMRCRRENDNRCIEKFWTGTIDNQNAWYNGINFQCKDLNLPDCANCSSRDERNLRELTQSSYPLDCSKEICDKLPPQVDPCYIPSSCACFCLRIEQGILSCPHLEDWVWTETRRQIPLT